MIRDKIVYTEIRVWKLDHARGGAIGWAKGNSHMSKGHTGAASVYFGHMSCFQLNIFYRHLVVLIRSALVQSIYNEYTQYYFHAEI